MTSNLESRIGKLEASKGMDDRFVIIRTIVEPVYDDHGRLIGERNLRAVKWNPEIRRYEDYSDEPET
ncbi:hypothetical protein J2X24_002119 [Asticcacaulis solisilvae]|nr:hypothetical protein [Asticcacaulis solisilvae]MDR6800621.1 hypothetical protein [Asticcacaulis sp. BE141]